MKRQAKTKRHTKPLKPTVLDPKKLQAVSGGIGTWPTPEIIALPVDTIIL